MIDRADIEERVREWGLREDVVEKDYVLGWLLWGIGSENRLRIVSEVHTWPSLPNCSSSDCRTSPMT